MHRVHRVYRVQRVCRGSQSLQDSQGAQGLQGSRAQRVQRVCRVSKGLPGVAGLAGFTGFARFTGLTGFAGFKGLLGYNGLQGFTGFTSDGTASSVSPPYARRAWEAQVAGRTTGAVQARLVLPECGLDGQRGRDASRTQARGAHARQKPTHSSLEPGQDAWHQPQGGDRAQRVGAVDRRAGGNREGGAQQGGRMA